ncbi:alpha/beta hydrolase [Cryobacterium roopkundense]|uniref:Alpha/beta hydrolase n=1 Tax=Cryobacterium roopkundense TaxID=1001240 RepID=A0A099J281_9MICO|nr:alpha/beta hydrolase [Cryobacterium roopkundense]KGJ72165.1 alpha/beta hydrolase [Cryobacterium roopkundense]MBB5643316.1 pimeloyl-ACP methyl ester carboxylesterase [Cryobacterium roopkundense]
MTLSRRAVDSEGVTISYLDSGGPGPTVVILHGLAGSAVEFIPTAESLSDFRALLVDQRGHGHSTRVPGDTSRAAFVADIVRVIEAEAHGPVSLVGQSMGAHTALMVAAARPDLVERLVLLEGGAGSGDRAENARLGDFFRSWPIPFIDASAARAHLGDGPLERAWVADLENRHDGLHPRFDPDVMVQIIDAVAVPRWGEWESVSVATLVVYANGGIFSEEDKAEFVRRGQHAQRIDVDEASHDAHLDAFDRWVSLLQSFLHEGQPR